MSSEKKQVFIDEPASCDICFGIVSLNNTSLVEQFFPDDLPEDWRISYYNNEFHLLLMNLSDLDFSCSEANKITFDEMVNCLTPYSDELDDGILLFDISPLSDKTQKELCDSQIFSAHNIYFINLNKDSQVYQQKQTHPTFESLFFHIENESAGQSLVCIVNNEQGIKPLDLRLLIESLQRDSLSKGYSSVKVLFSSVHHALEDCRNATLLEAMM